MLRASTSWPTSSGRKIRAHSKEYVMAMYGQISLISMNHCPHSSVERLPETIIESIIGLFMNLHMIGSPVTKLMCRISYTDFECTRASKRFDVWWNNTWLSPDDIDVHTPLYGQIQLNYRMRTSDERHVRMPLEQYITSERFRNAVNILVDQSGLYITNGSSEVPTPSWGQNMLADYIRHCQLKAKDNEGGDSVALVNDLVEEQRKLQLTTEYEEWNTLERPVKLVHYYPPPSTNDDMHIGGTTHWNLNIAMSVISTYKSKPAICHRGLLHGDGYLRTGDLWKLVAAYCSLVDRVVQGNATIEYDRRKFIVSGVEEPEYEKILTLEDCANEHEWNLVQYQRRCKIGGSEYGWYYDHLTPRRSMPPTCC